jgi:hypothetical protein
MISCILNLKYSCRMIFSFRKKSSIHTCTKGDKQSKLASVPASIIFITTRARRRGRQRVVQVEMEAIGQQRPVPHQTASSPKMLLIYKPDHRLSVHRLPVRYQSTRWSVHLQANHLKNLTPALHSSPQKKSTISSLMIKK